MRKLVFGPVPSRRLGLSLGVDVIPLKTCSFNCIYCQIGRTPRPTLKREVYVDPEEVIAQVRKAIEKGPRPDYITFSGSGEPTLNSALGSMIDGIKRLTDIPVAVITNGSLLWEEGVREDLKRADLILPSLDAASEGAFRRINRPAPGLTIEKIIDGLRRFCEEFEGGIWLEVMLVEGVNDDPEELRRLGEVVSSLKIDKVQLNTPVRPPAEGWVRPLDRSRMEAIAEEFFGGRAEVIADFSRESPKIYGAAESAILEMLRRRPCTAEEISDSLGIPLRDVLGKLKAMGKRGLVIEREHVGKVYYLPAG